MGNTTDATWKERGLALEMRGGRTFLVSEAFLPFVKVSGQTFYANEKPSVVVNGKKHIVKDVV